MRLRTMANCVKDGFKGILRNGLMSLASIGTITACLMILGLTYCDFGGYFAFLLECIGR